MNENFSNKVSPKSQSKKKIKKKIIKVRMPRNDNKKVNKNIDFYYILQFIRKRTIETLTKEFNPNENEWIANFSKDEKFEKMEQLEGISKESLYRILNRDTQKVFQKLYKKNLSWQCDLVDKRLKKTSIKKIQKVLKNLRKKGNWGLCPECQQPYTSWVWCKDCNIGHFEDDFLNLSSGKQEIDDFIRKHQSETDNSRKVLEWIPYDQFENIEYLAEGGFSKVYRANWKRGEINHWDSDKKNWDCISNKNVVLKNLNDSQKITTDFFKEVINHHLFEDGDLIVRCYGISQNPQTKNYIMVMDDIEGVNLRTYLKDNIRKIYLKTKKQSCFELQIQIKWQNFQQQLSNLRSSYQRWYLKREKTNSGKNGFRNIFFK